MTIKTTGELKLNSPDYLIFTESVLSLHRKISDRDLAIITNNERNQPMGIIMGE